MAWERRKRAGRYYYRARREDGHVRKEYIGRGATAVAAAREDRIRRAERAKERRRLLDFESGLWSIKAKLKLIGEACRQAYHASHYIAGFHQSSSSNWRPRRITMMDSKKSHESPVLDVGSPGASTDHTPPVSKAELPSSINETLALLKNGRTDLLPHLRWQLRQVPKLWQHCGDLGRLTQAALARAIAGDDDLVRESIMLAADQDRLELVGNDAAAAQRLLAERVVLNRMQVAMFEQMDAQNTRELLGSRVGQSVEKRLQSANHQLRESIRQLETVRRLDQEMAPRKSAAVLRIFDPDQKRKSA